MSSTIIEKSGLPEEEFDIVIEKLAKYVLIISNEKLVDFIQKANEIIGVIDEDDIPFIAASLSLDSCPIWSDDKHFQLQKNIEIYTTEKIVKELGING